MNEMQVMNIGGVDCYEVDGVAYLKLETVARGLGFTRKAESGNEVIRWERVNRYLSELNYVPTRGHDGFIPENIFYRLAMKAKNEVAEAFQAKVADEIIPSIRKHGMYATPQTIDNIINDPDFGIRLLTELKNEREKNSVLAAQNTELQEKIETDQPFTDFGIAISTSEGSITVKQFAALICQRGYKTGEKRMFEELRQDGFLLTTGSYYNEPAQRWMEQKIFEVRTSNYTNKFGNQQIARQPLITAKGIEYLMNYYLRKHGLMELLTIHRRNVVDRRRLR